MEALVAIIFGLSAIAVIPAFAASIYCTRALNRYVRERYPDIWRKIEPPLSGQSSLSSPSVRFITERTYRILQDPRLNALGDRSFWFLHLAVSVFLVLVLSGLGYDGLKA